MHRIVKQLAEGLQFLHDECKLVHQDLHSNNIMVVDLLQEDRFGDESLAGCTIKILDLGLAKDHEVG